MTITKTVKQTVQGIVGSYKKDIEQAAGNNILTKREEAKLDKFAKRHLTELRQEVDTVTVGKAVAHLRPIITSAAAAIAGADGKIDSTDVRKLRVTELRVRAASLFEDGGVAGAKSLRKAVNATDVPQIGDMGKTFALRSFPATATPESMVSKIVDLAPADLGRLTQWGSVATGASAVREFSAHVRQAGQEQVDGANDDAEAAVYKQAYNGVADAVKGFFVAEDFKKFVYGSHSIAEDGDCAYDILMAQKRDGSWVTLTYSDFPF